MSTNTILATTPLVTTNFLLRATGTTIGNSLIFDNGTNVGIGNTNTTYKLDVSGTGNFTGALSGTSATFSGTITSTGVGLNPSLRLTNTTATTGIDWHLYSLNNGNFGLYNNTAGAYALQIASTGAATFSSDIQGGGDLYFNKATRTTIYPTTTNQNLHMKSNGSGVLQFNNDNTGNLTMCVGGGRVSIGSASTAYNFNVYGASGTDGWGAFFGGAGTTKGGIYLGNDGTQYGTLYFDNATNNVILKQSYASGTVNVIANTNGVYLANGATSWTAISSDERKKKNFEIVSGLDVILQVEPVKYHFLTDDDTSKKRLGFKAQNIQPLIPEMVLETGELAEDGSPYLTVTPDYILPVLVKAIQEQNQIIQELSNRLIKLESK